MEFETGRRSTLARLQLSVQGLAGSLNSAKKVLVASTVLTAAFCGAVFGLTLVANEASKESHVSNGLLTTIEGDVVKTSENKTMKSLAMLSAETIAKQDFVSFSQDGADRYMQILGVQATASKKVINTIVGAFEVTEEGMTFAGDNVVLEATEADKAARKAACAFCKNGRNAKCLMCGNGRGFAVAGRDNMCAFCQNANIGRNFQCQICKNGRAGQCRICLNGMSAGRSNQCQLCMNQGRNQQCVYCKNGRNTKCTFCNNGRSNQWSADSSAQDGSSSDCDRGAFDELMPQTSIDDNDTDRATARWCSSLPPREAAHHPECGNGTTVDITSTDREGFPTAGIVSADFGEGIGSLVEAGLQDWQITVCHEGSEEEACFGS